METITTILVPLAFTDYSAGVFNRAVETARRNGSDIIVLSVINSRDIESVERIVSLGYEVNSDHYVDDVRKDRKAKLNAMADAAGFPRERLRVMFKVGKPVDEILRTIAAEAPDLVVMGTRGRSELENSIMGSVAEKIFKYSPVDVLSYRDPEVRARLRSRIRP